MIITTLIRVGRLLPSLTIDPREDTQRRFTRVSRVAGNRALYHVTIMGLRYWDAGLGCTATCPAVETRLEQRYRMCQLRHACGNAQQCTVVLHIHPYTLAARHANAAPLCGTRNRRRFPQFRSKDLCHVATRNRFAHDSRLHR